MFKLQNYKNIIFDLDNTLLDQSQYDQEIFRLYFENCADTKKIATELGTSLAIKKRNAAYGYNRTFDDFFKLRNINLSVKSLIQFYHLPPLVSIKPSDLILNTLNSLVGKNIILVTNGYPRVQYNKILSMGIGSFFSQIYVLSLHDGPELKPSNEILKRLILTKGKSVYIGDNLEIDKKFAENCNFEFIHFNITNI
jgi:putative hydrolase of the HAD superfamily